MRSLDIALKLLGLADVICAWQAKLARLDKVKRVKVAEYAEAVADSLARLAAALERLENDTGDRGAGAVRCARSAGSPGTSRRSLRRSKGTWTGAGWPVSSAACGRYPTPRAWRTPLPASSRIASSISSPPRATCGPSPTACASNCCDHECWPAPFPRRSARVCGRDPSSSPRAIRRRGARDGKG